VPSAAQYPYIRAMLVMIDPPTPFDTLATWQRHLADVRRLPDDVALKSETLRTAEEAVARRRHP
jgi:hypothetical protein